MWMGLVFFCWFIFGSVLHTANFQPFTSSECPAVCAGEIALPSVCQEPVISECTNIGYSKYNASKLGNPVRLQKIDVRQGATLGQYDMQFTWGEPIEGLGIFDVGYIVKMNSTKGVDSPSCKVLSFHNFPQVQHLTFHDCFAQLQPNSTVNLTLTHLPSNISSSYLLQVPNNLSLVTDPPSLESWQSIVGISAEAANSSISAVFLEAPVLLNLTSYRVTLKYAAPPSSAVQEVILQQGEWSHTFSKVAPNEMYIVQVEPETCGTSCSPTVSAPIYLADVVVSTPSPPTSTTVSSSTVTTTTRSIPGGHSRATTTTTQDSNVIVEPANKRQEYEKAIKIILGTVCGVIGAAIIIGVICCLYRQRRHTQTGNFPMQRFGHGRESDSSIGLDHAYKQQQPMVLIVYSYDCAAHEQVVLKFAEYLRQSGHCDVTLDITEKAHIQEQGIYNWVHDRIEISQFVIVICSTGARYKCARNRQFRVKHDREIPDVFAWTVDCVAEQMRMARNQGGSTERFLVAYFDYVNESDIPPKLELAQKFNLMKDVFGLYCHIHGLKPETARHDDGAVHNGVTMETYEKTEAGKELHDTILEAKQYFKDNPDWLGQILEPVTPAGTPSKSGEAPSTVPSRNEGDINSPANQRVKANPPARQRKPSPSSSLSSEEEAFLAERRKKRLKDKEKYIDRIPLTKKSKRDRHEPNESPGNGNSQVTSNSSSAASTSPLMPNPPKALVVNNSKPEPVPLAPQKDNYAKTNGTKDSTEIDIDDDLEEEDLEKDIDLIKNFDTHQFHWWNNAPQNQENSRDSILDLDLGGYSPPEEYLSLASLHEVTLDSPSLASVVSEGKQSPGSTSGQFVIDRVGENGTMEQI